METAVALRLTDEHLIAERCLFWTLLCTVPVTATVLNHPAVISTQGQGDSVDGVETLLLVPSEAQGRGISYTLRTEDSHPSEENEAENQVATAEAGVQVWG